MFWSSEICCTRGFLASSSESKLWPAGAETLSGRTSVLPSTFGGRLVNGASEKQSGRFLLKSDVCGLRTSGLWNVWTFLNVSSALLIFACVFSRRLIFVSISEPRLAGSSVSSSAPPVFRLVISIPWHPRDERMDSAWVMLLSAVARIFLNWSSVDLQTLRFFWLFQWSWSDWGPLDCCCE